MTEQHLNSAQIQQVERKVLEHTQNLMKNINLRQWAVEQALTHCARHSDFKELEEMFEKIYTFVSKPV